MQDPNELIRRAGRALVAPCLNAIAVICVAGITLVALRGPITDSVKKALIREFLPPTFEILSQCPRCEGTGMVEFGRFHPFVLSGHRQAGTNPCGTCDGTGKKTWLKHPSGR